MSRWRTMRLPSGAVVPSGLDARRRGEARPLAPRSALARAIVVNTYTTDNPVSDPNDPTSAPLSRSRTSVECDVVLVRSNVALSRVPVLQSQHGVNNASGLWVPRESTRVISTGADVSFRPVGPRGETNPPASDYSDLDGDHVLVGFIENDHEHPVIVGALTHTRTKRLVIGAPDSIGWEEGDDSTRGKPYRNEAYSVHYGTEHRVNARGDVLIDTVGAYTDPATEDASGSVGQIRLRVKNSQRFTVEMDGTDVLEVWKDGGQVRIDLGEGASERVVLGDSFRDFLNDFLTNIFDQHTHSSGTGTTGTPLPAFVSPIRQDMGADLLSDLVKAKK